MNVATLLINLFAIDKQIFLRIEQSLLVTLDVPVIAINLISIYNSDFNFFTDMLHNAYVIVAIFFAEK